MMFWGVDALFNSGCSWNTNVMIVCAGRLTGTVSHKKGNSTTAVETLVGSTLVATSLCMSG